jgi:hypothetical protein
MRHSHCTHPHRGRFLLGAGIACLAWTTSALADDPAAPQPQPPPSTQPPPPAASGTTPTTTVTNSDGSVTTTTVVTTPVVIPSEPIATTKTTSYFQSERTVPPNYHSLEAPTNSVELSVAAVYEQPFGQVTQGQSLSDTSGGGGGLHIALGYRLSPEFALALYGTGASFAHPAQSDPTAHSYTASTGIEADLHLMPSYHRADPWISVGSGWRGYWTNEASGNVSAQGWEIAKLQLGVDIRFDRDLAISPVVGADINTFFYESTPSSPTFGAISNPWANTFFFAGLMGRFDFASSVATGQVAAR